MYGRSAVACKIIRSDQTTSSWCGVEVWRVFHVSSSSSDRGSKLRGPSQNSPRVASKQAVNITKLNSMQTIAKAEDEDNPGLEPPDIPLLKPVVLTTQPARL
ncbi:hypothetical protein AVEN_175982-1 [Araneus ventricosus]|uniref:Uncharacterized protein n=1 Tax=Araneus ventricosus TaxID=182803 RepID=A0A4Y2EJI6_ARAVE|nr:hypothetical protein AVEN_175982-1 [Araneus ventricosus]